jgi:hypothetical protein
MKFLSVLAASSQRRARRFFLCAALALASVLSGAVGLGFATYALFEAWRQQYGIVNAALGLGAIYIILAVILYLCCLRVGAKPRPAANSDLGSASDQTLDAVKAAAQADGAPQAAALAMGVELAKQMSPLQLAMLAVLSGFIAGRRL